MKELLTAELEFHNIRMEEDQCEDEISKRASCDDKSYGEASSLQQATVVDKSKGVIPKAPITKCFV